ncbi:alpha/beta fold hydrolase [Zavarzinia compransoris]|uniref:alpha/beta fold hydrolase n=1 Tax=Zavarzinia compransoris TaxID=1264899 RepID=UPI0010DF32F5|nr:alpha/beta hydrolase [Zavarzinia compransoris]TDP49152.1 alpha-beta hydrolase superfamily lysophospholipase [Zavarzinia compransoris]
MSLLARIEIPAEGGFFSGLAGGPPLGSAPLVHLAHATGMNAETYRPILEALARRYTVRALDLRGHGFSTVPADPRRLRSWSRYARDLAGILEGWGQPAFLVGHSMGGAISTEVAALHPGLAAGLLLIDPAVVPKRAVPALAFGRVTGLMRRFPLAEQAAKRRADWPGREVMLKAYTGRGAFKTWRPEFLDAYVQGGTTDKPDGTIALACAPAWEAQTFATIGLSFWRRVPKLVCPVGVLYADKGSTLGRRGAASLSKVLPAAAVTRVPESTHFIPMEFPAVVEQAIDALVENKLRTIS